MLEPYTLAIREVTGSSPEDEQVRLAGRTDVAILGSISRELAVEPTHGHMEDLIRAYHRHLQCHLESHPRVPVEGAKRFIGGLIKANACFALATGNTREAASLKLASAEMGDLLRCGAFARQGPERSSILRAAVQTSQSFYGCEFHSIVYFGDTPSDVAAAKEIDAKSVAVAAGSYTREQLAASRPDCLISDFDDFEALCPHLAELIRDPRNVPTRG